MQSTAQHLLDPTASRDFMAHGYSLIAEPLNLHEKGQSWLRRIYDHECGTGQTGMVLGATAWIAAMLRNTRQRVTMVDMSPQMLKLAEAALSKDASHGVTGVEAVEANWLSLPALSPAPDTVIGDNSFSFLPFPEGWAKLCNELADRMAPEGKLMIRVLSPPESRSPVTIDQLVARFAAQPTLNCTELRAALLFAHWNAESYAIDTEGAYGTFEKYRAKFNALLERFRTGPENDLVTMCKYKNAGAVFYAPPLGEILHCVRNRFHISQIHFGPYPMSEYFPLLVASVR